MPQSQALFQQGRFERRDLAKKVFELKNGQAEKTSLAQKTLEAEQQKVADLQFTQKLTVGEADLVKEVIRLMGEKTCSICGMQGHVRAHCWLTQQINADMKNVHGEIWEHWERYKAAQEQEQTRMVLQARAEEAKQRKTELTALEAAFKTQRSLQQRRY